MMTVSLPIPAGMGGDANTHHGLVGGQDSPAPAGQQLDGP
jgi:hypothetical protein